MKSYEDQRFFLNCNLGSMQNSQTDQQKKFPQPPLEKPIANPDNLIDLPTPENLVNPGKDFYEIINQRRSRRKYTAESIDLEHLSFLLWCTQGVKKYLIEKKIK